MNPANWALARAGYGPLMHLEAPRTVVFHFPAKTSDTGPRAMFKDIRLKRPLKRLAKVMEEPR